MGVTAGFRFSSENTHLADVFLGSYQYVPDFTQKVTKIFEKSAYLSSTPYTLEFSGIPAYSHFRRSYPSMYPRHTGHPDHKFFCHLFLTQWHLYPSYLKRLGSALT